MTREVYGLAYERHFAKTVSFLRKRGVPSDTAPDIAQTAWMKGWEKIGQLRNESFLPTWIHRIAFNQYLQEIRRKRPLYLADIDQRETSGLLADQSVEQQDAAIDVRRVLVRCRPKYRALLVAQMEGSTGPELAREHSVSKVCMRLRLLRARNAARGILGG